MGWGLTMGVLFSVHGFLKHSELNRKNNKAIIFTNEPNHCLHSAIFLLFSQQRNNADSNLKKKWTGISYLKRLQWPIQKNTYVQIWNPR